jgi:signal transduction histidine kinase
MIVRECERLTRIVDDLLLANNLDLDNLYVQPETADAVALAHEVTQLRDGTVPEGTTLSVVANGETIRVACDRDRLRQVLDNLVDNAIKYSPQGGDVRIAVETAGPRGRFVVTDGGIGIPVAEQDRIFEKFYRLDPELSRGVGGSGLGLYISRELVRRMDGRLTVESEPGRGSRFTVELPLAR